ncbi:MAG: glycosyltransferase [Planctomycetes bacterium]|nr:glycosyltransferase [Planctomycetota bacterium]
MLSRGGADYSSRSLAALAPTIPASAEVILVDDGTQDDSVQRAFDGFASANTHVPVRTVRFDSSVGAVLGRNHAASLARGSFLALLDNDCFPRTSSWLPSLRSVFDRRPDTGVAGVRLVYPLAAPGAVPVIQCAGCVVSVSGRVGFRGRGEHADGSSFANEEPVQAVISACWLTPRALWNDVGGMDPAFSPCQFEDIDYCYRARSLGFSVVYVPSVEMYHFENVTSAGLPSAGYAALTARNSRTFQAKWRKFLAAENAPHPSSIDWRTDVPVIRLSDDPCLELT